MALPVFKLVYVFAKQIAKPIGKGLVSYSQQHPWMRTKVIEPVGQFAHWISVRADRIVVGNWRDAVRRLPPEEALQWGGAVMSETFIFSVAAGFVIVEFWDGSKKNAAKEAKLTAWRGEVEQRTQEIQSKLEELMENEAKLRAELEKMRSQQQAWSVHATAAQSYSTVNAVAASAWETASSMLSGAQRIGSDVLNAFNEGYSRHPREGQTATRSKSAPPQLSITEVHDVQPDTSNITELEQVAASTVDPVPTDAAMVLTADTESSGATVR